ncbi:MAG: hypothetical protein FWG14_07110 [Peptococcaceae bacterium]|nr:hypothetical protein [Peptococcaceae bacterium]
MKNKIVIFSLIIVFLLGSLIILAWKMGWFCPPISEETEEIPAREIGIDKDMEESIFKKMLENPQEPPASLVTVNENDQNVYNGQAIEDLLHKGSENMEAEDYVILLQLVQGMTEAYADGTVVTDFEAIRQLILRGYNGAYLTPVMANLCTLYKAWVEDYVVAPQSSVIFSSRDTEEKKTLGEQLEQEMFKTSLLDAILMNDNEIYQNKNDNSQDIPEINIIYEPGEYGLNDYHAIQIGNKAVRIYPFRNGLFSTINGVREKKLKDLPLDEAEKKRKNEELWELQVAVHAYATAATLAVSEECNIQMVACYNDTELEIRARAYGTDLYEKTGKTEYQNVTGLDLKAQATSDDQDQMAQYKTWWGEYQQSYENYKTDLVKVLDKYKETHPKFIGTRLESLTPAQIRELGKKIKDPSYTPNLGDVP